MLAITHNLIQRCTLFAAGLISKGSMSGGHLDGGFGEVIFGALMGAFLGLLFGLMLAHVIRYCSFLMGRYQSGYNWTIISVVAGAAICAIWAAGGDAESSMTNPDEGIVER